MEYLGTSARLTGIFLAPDLRLSLRRAYKPAIKGLLQG